jgi:four helix bundle protein
VSVPRTVIQRFDQLRCWQHAFDFACECYRVVKLLPRAQERSLSDQLQRSAASVPANIAEGFGRGSQQDFACFFYIARGSLFEAETHLRLAESVGLVHRNRLATALELRERCGRSLNALISTIRHRSRAREHPTSNV